MKKSVRKLRNILWSLLLSAAIVIESTAGSVVVYATEIKEERTTPVVEETIEEPDESEESEEPGEGQEDTDESEDDNDGDDSNTNDEGRDDNAEDGSDESDEDGSGENDSDENDEDNSDESEDDVNGSDETEEDGTDSDEIKDDGNISDEEEADESDEEVGEETDSEEKVELEDLLAALASKDSLLSKELEKLLEESSDLAEEMGYATNGYHDVDYDVGDLKESVDLSDDSFPRANTATTLPTKYDAREHGQVSSIKDQNPWGTCWSFSAVNSAESAYVMAHDGSEANLSEVHLVNFFYNGNTGANVSGPDGGLEGDKTTALGEDPVERGGNSMFTTFALASWTGVANEATDPSLEYNAIGGSLPIIDDSLAYADEMHLENAYWIKLSDESYVKNAIMELGTVGVSYYHSSVYDSYYSRNYNGPAVYYNFTQPSTNHAVAIVGWDDDFDKNNFRNTPAYVNYYNSVYDSLKELGYEDAEIVEILPDALSKLYPGILPENNGAWLIKNSWGTSYGDGGYFWISYEDLSLVDGTAFAFDFGSADNYDHNYQYDGSNGLQKLGYSDGGTFTAAAVYTASGSQKISAVGVGFASTSTDYTVQIYTGLTDESDPESGELATTVTGKTSFEGFYTIDIKDRVFVNKGEKFGVVVTARRDEGVYLFIDASYDGSWISFTADTTNDKTYYKSGKTWVNAATQYDSTFRIKAYTHDVNLDNAREDDKVLQDYMLEEIAPQVFNGGAVKPDFRLVFNGTLLTKDRDYTVTYLNRSNEKAGMATAVIEAIEGSGYSGKFNTSFTITKKAITADMISPITDRIYDGTNYVPEVVIKNDENAKSGGVSVVMTQDKDYTVKYSKSPLNAGTYTVTVTAAKNSDYSGSAKASFKIEKLNLESEDVNVSLTLPDESYVYDGKECKPAVTVTTGINGEKTIPASNYTVKYANNKNAGGATVTVTGKGNCQGTVTRYFSINPKVIGQDGIAQEGISVTVKNGTYTSNEVKPTVTVKDDKTTLKLNRDYELSYDNNINATKEAKVTVEGIGNYSGTIDCKFEIAPQSVAANKIKVEAVADGNNTVNVTVNGKLIKSTDGYTLTIKRAGKDELAGNLQCGEKYDINVKLNGNYKAPSEDGVTIKNVACKKSVASLIIALKNPEDAQVTYSGKAYKPAIIVTDEGKTVAAKYYSVSYSDNVNAGTATITVIGKGNYSGTKLIPFTIKKKAAELTVAIPEQTYANKELSPVVTIKDGKTKLKVGKDYTVEYYNHINVARDESGEPIAAAEARITLLNYEKVEGESSTTTQFTKKFKIKPAVITSVKISGSAYFKGDTDGDGLNEVVEPTLKVMAGKLQLTEDDYKSVYGNQRDVSTSKVKAFVKVTGIGNFADKEKTVKYSVTKEPLSKAKVYGMEDQVYHAYGEEGITTPFSLYDSANEIFILAFDHIPNGYTVTYKNNKKAGTASVTIKAGANSIYSGSVTKKFKITKADLEDVLTDSESALQAKTYTGSKLTYTANEVGAAIKPVDGASSPTYKISYKNNANAGTGTVVLTGTGNYTGKYCLDFTISRRHMDDVRIDLKSQSVKLGALATIKQAVYGKLKLKVKKDYTLSYINSSQPGDAFVMVTGAGNYTGTKAVWYEVTDAR